MRRWTLFAILLPLTAFALKGDQLRQNPSSAALRFLNSLTKEQHQKAVLPFESDYRTLWRYTPATRQGVSWKDLDPDQANLAHEFIKSVLSELGYRRTQDIRTIEQVLSGIENSARRDKDYYFLTFFGQPSATGRWGWRYEGHHISLNLTFQGNDIVSSTPQFFGSNPAEVPSGELKGTRILAKEEDAAIAFLASLNADQKKLAIIADRAPNEIATAENREAARQPDSGIKFTQLDSGQQKDLLDLVRLNAEAQNPVEVKRRMDAISKAGHEKLTFAWMGAPDRSAAHYYRIQGPTFLIEFDNSQNRANHIHLVWRDFEGDFGRDVLKDHYRQHEHDPDHGHDH
jgi:hypothetical protein